MCLHPAATPGAQERRCQRLIFCCLLSDGVSSINITFSAERRCGRAVSFEGVAVASLPDRALAMMTKVRNRLYDTALTMFAGWGLYNTGLEKTRVLLACLPGGICMTRPLPTECRRAPPDVLPMRCTIIYPCCIPVVDACCASISGLNGGGVICRR